MPILPDVPRDQKRLVQGLPMHTGWVRSAKTDKDGNVILEVVHFSAEGLKAYREEVIRNETGQNGTST